MRTRTRVLIALTVALHGIVLFAGFIAPCDPAAQNRLLPYAPPTLLHFRGADGWHVRPFVYRMVAGPGGYEEDRNQPFPIRFLVRGPSYQLFGLIPSTWHLFGVVEPTHVALFGTDGFGRDEFSRVLYGGQISMAAGIAATLIALTAGTLVGLLAGFYGRWIDDSLMAGSELFLSLPWLYFLLGVRAFLPLHLSPVRTFFLLTAVIGLIGWARPARLVRGIVLSVRSRNFVLAAQSFGASDLYVIRRHIFPEVWAVLLTQAALLVPRYIAAEVTLSFFGLGVSEPVSSWGNMLSTLQQYSVLVSYTWLLAPIGALVITSVIYALLADTLHSHLEFHST
jgi:peptide/nickel transport system permease protein